MNTSNNLFQASKQAINQETHFRTENKWVYFYSDQGTQMMILIVDVGYIQDMRISQDFLASLNPWIDDFTKERDISENDGTQQSQ